MNTYALQASFKVVAGGVVSPPFPLTKADWL